MATKGEVERDLGRLEGGVGTLTKLSFAVLAFLVALVGGGFFVLIQVGEIKSDLALLRHDVGDVTKRLERVESSLEKVQTSQLSNTGSLARIETQLAGKAPATPQLLIAIDDARTIRAVIQKATAFEVTYDRVAKIGDVLSDAKLQAFPDELSSRYPLLKNMGYVIDPKKQIVIAALSDQRVVALV